MLDFVKERDVFACLYTHRLWQVEHICFALLLLTFECLRGSLDPSLSLFLP